ncbi:adenylate/guanylate cyclase domain-containing protein [Methylobacterium sp. Leaf466]|uniref:CHASE2 domain-containing protein n=1 Tax=Methylobacterium sp. Leaf466 TaxID=1736386 RepID=UPI000ABBA31C|nr:adenylate/guanylate cyclase domain-containing protein [Methylobacterium sp. Leaf466]
MRRGLRRLSPVMAGLAALLAVLALRATLADPFERLRLAGFDLLQRAAPRTLATPAPVRVVDIDDATLARHGQWPWSRDTVAGLVDTLRDLGAAAIALDVVFAEPDRTSPRTLAETWRTRYGWQGDAAGDRLPDHDETLAASFAKGRVVSGYGLLPADNGAAAPARPGFAVLGPDPAAHLPGFSGVIANIPLLERAAAGHGSFTIAAGRDEIVRRLPILGSLRGGLVPSLALEALRVAQGEDTVRVRTEQNGGPDGAVTGFTVRVGSLEIPLDAEGALLLHHSGSVRERSVPAWRLMQPQLDAAAREAVAGHIVLLGTSAVGLGDLRPTPLNAYEPGINVHAEALEQILTGATLDRPAWAGGVEIVAAAGLALAAALAAAALGLRLATGLTGLAIAALGLGAWLAYVRAGLLVDATLPGLVVGLSFSAAILTRHLLAEGDALHLRQAFTHYLSPDLVQALVADPGALKLGGETRTMTFLFTDLEGFTSLTETRGAESLVALLNGYLDGLCGVAMAHGGTVDKIVGDAVHVMFNAPLDQPDHAERAVACALAMDAFATGFSAAQGEAGVPFGKTRIGVNTGPAVVGNFGGARRFDYTAHGDAINTAARLEAANKALGTRICIAGSTVAGCPGRAFRPIGTLMLRGKAQGVPVFEPAPAVCEAAFETRYRDAFDRLAAGEEAGAQAMLALHAERPQDAVVALHARRIGAGDRSLRIAA